MSEPIVQPAAAPAEAPALSQMQRVTNIFTAPSKTFIDIRDHSRAWWMPFLIMVVFGYILFAAITMKVGWAQVAENAIHMNPKSEERLAQAPPDQRETTMKITTYSMEGGFAATPLLVLAILALGSLVLWGTINFMFGGKATFGGIFCVWMYSGLIGVIKTILGTIMLFTGVAPESFNLNNFAPTSIGAFLSPTETNQALYRLASSIDFTTIWSLAVMSIGVATVARVKRTSGYFAVFGWWALTVLVGVGWAAAFG